MDHGHHVVGVDISESGIRVAKTKVPAATFELIDTETQIPFPDESLDICFCTEVIEHLFYVGECIDEIHRLLAKDGLFLLTTPYHGGIKNSWALIMMSATLTAYVRGTKIAAPENRDV